MLDHHLWVEGSRPGQREDFCSDDDLGVRFLTGILQWGWPFISVGEMLSDIYILTSSDHCM